METLNHLQHEKSLYLRQHAHNPVDWWPWGREALERARIEDKPIFLSIGYSACHWCHVMAHESFADAQVVDLLNRGFVCIKVDREERPDLDTAYMRAVQALTGSGGWPMSVFLTPQGLPFFGGTYFPKSAFCKTLQHLLELYAERRELIDEQVNALVEALATQQPLGHPVRLRPEDIDRAVSGGLEAVDVEQGGLRGGMKFPTPLIWRFLLRQQHSHPDPRVGLAIERTLTAMAAGGLCDALGGGFHRYTIDPHWTVPHFEKMLTDNTLLAGLYAEAAEVLDKPAYREVARTTFDFMLSEMQLPGGGLAAAWDADSPEGEGAFYTWTQDELNAVAGPEDGRRLAVFLGVEKRGPVAGRGVLTRRLPAGSAEAETGLSWEALCTVFTRHRPALLSTRARRPPPVRDPKVITAWNGLALSALAEGATRLRDNRYRTAAEDLAGFLWEHQRRPDGRLARVSYDGFPAQPDGVLDDYSFLAAGLLDLHRLLGRGPWLARAGELLATARRLFRSSDGSYHFVAEGVTAPLGRLRELFDQALPSGAAVLVHAFQDATELGGEDGFAQEASNLLYQHGSVMQAVGWEMAWWWDAQARLLTSR